MNQKRMNQKRTISLSSQLIQFELTNFVSATDKGILIA